MHVSKKAGLVVNFGHTSGNALFLNKMNIPNGLSELSLLVKMAVVYFYVG
jgi:hypothetical protein